MDDDVVALAAYDHPRVRIDMLRLVHGKPELYSVQTLEARRIEYGFMIKLKMAPVHVSHEIMLLIPYEYPIKEPYAFYSTKDDYDYENEEKLDRIPHRLGQAKMFSLGDKWTATMDLMMFLNELYFSMIGIV